MHRPQLASRYSVAAWTLLIAASVAMAWLGTLAPLPAERAGPAIGGFSLLALIAATVSFVIALRRSPGAVEMALTIFGLAATSVWFCLFAVVIGWAIFVGPK